MTIIDLDGNTLEVTDLDEAIRQAEYFKDRPHTDENFQKSDEKLNKYWTDIYDKLLRLKIGHLLTGTG